MSKYTTELTKTPDGREVMFADIDVRFNGGEPETVRVIIDDVLSDTHVDYRISNEAWENFDHSVFYYLSTDEWESLNRGESIMEWRLA